MKKAFEGVLNAITTIALSVKSKLLYSLMLIAHLMGALKISAQEAAVVTGGNGSGTGGSFSYSVGQIDYKYTIGVNGSEVQGVQQPYEISVVIGIHEESIELEMNVYPNPTIDFITLNITQYEI